MLNFVKWKTDVFSTILWTQAKMESPHEVNSTIRWDIQQHTVLPGDDKDLLNWIELNWTKNEKQRNHGCVRKGFAYDSCTLSCLYFSYLLALKALQDEGDRVHEELLAEERLLSQLIVKTKDALVKHSAVLK